MEEMPQKEVAERRNVLQLTWWDGEDLSRYVSETGKILSRQYTHLTAREQRRVARLIKRARNMLRMK
jgi:ribosomal protein S18